METKIAGLIVLVTMACSCMAQLGPFSYELRQAPLGFMNQNQKFAPMNGRGAFHLANRKGVSEVKPYPDVQMLPKQSMNKPIVDNIFLQPPPMDPECPLEVHPDTETMFIMRGPLGDPEPRNCPPGTYFLRSVCSCVNTPLDKCNLRPSFVPGWYEENVFGTWLQRPCGPGSAFNPETCDCSYTL